MGIKVMTKTKRRKKLLYEIGMTIFLAMVLLGVLSGISRSVQVPLVTTEQLLNMTTSQGFINSTSGSELWPKYNVSDVATMYNGYLYITISAPSGYDKFYGFNFWLSHPDGTPITFKELAEKGINRIRVEVEFPSDVNMTGYSMTVQLYKPFTGGTDVWLKTVDIVNNTVVIDEPIDTGDFIAAATAKGVLSSQAMLGIYKAAGSAAWPIPSYVKVKVTIYGMSEKPVLAIYAHPLYATFTAVVSALYAAVRRIQQYALSAFGGLGLATLFSGLTGSAIAAMVLAIIFFVVMVELRKKR